jgi:hypothetical protein
MEWGCASTEALAQRCARAKLFLIRPVGWVAQTICGSYIRKIRLSGNCTWMKTDQPRESLSLRPRD